MIDRGGVGDLFNLGSFPPLTLIHERQIGYTMIDRGTHACDHEYDALSRI